MNDHDLIQLATKYGSWFGNTLELRKEGLAKLASDIAQQAYQEGYNDAAFEFGPKDPMKVSTKNDRL